MLMNTFAAFCAGLGEGVLVEHKRFGQGVIISVDEQTVTVEFESGVKMMDLQLVYAKKLLREGTS